MRKMNHLRTFGIVLSIFIILFTIGYTVQHDTAFLPTRLITDGVSIVQRGYIGLIGNVKGVGTNVSDLLQAHEENKLLREQMMNYQMLSLERDQLEAENESLRIALDTGATLRDFNLSYAITIGRNIPTWDDFIIVNKGQQDNVEVDMAVLSKEGYLIGRVTQVNQFSSKVQLNNLQNRTVQVPVIINGKPDSYGGLLDGYDSLTGNLIVNKVPLAVEVEEGDEVITSGLGQVMPSGLSIGYVEQVEISADGLTQTLYLTKEMDYNNLDTVILVKREAVRGDND